MTNSSSLILLFWSSFPELGCGRESVGLRLNGVKTELLRAKGAFERVVNGQHVNIQGYIPILNFMIFFFRGCLSQQFSLSLPIGVLRKVCLAIERPVTPRLHITRR